ncbi:tetrathionate respiration histidine kinase TtrS [Proteus mirabilis]|uniref:tetrathionate respiration histidine kinase TtrS n=1 Tax=Proteus mirabilis TaxID=584 RepID=UPI00234B6CAD|nr:tetrathionate respiration histidine kinase TtrS [Proteus mirabilis]MDC5888055.1 tetrathionate respiration histidine kinase TtrS [Proteus mirabilis]MDC5895293.1 tetrathionate respiration histidine kinase TtrS [Proteus mirabilis]MDC5905653.1 tetrathionate respiration histidine kinase TtrS [Proteus mirabilis]MDC5909195.1 tetrathionate respiration histidine kinase TtrS [Proteus mirabilis]MDC5916427.1 tetrathionate respiration histidine kinase TtrS [Proteus mirabilis]
MTIKQTIGIKKIASLSLLLLFFLLSSSAVAKEWTIGVLALRGDASTQRHWQPLIDTLDQQIPTDSFLLLPLNLSEMKQAVADKRVDFLLTNPAQFVQLDSAYPLRWLLSLRSGYEPDNTTRNVIGSLILVRKDSAITSIHELVGKRVGAIAPDAFGGYLLGYKALREEGIDPEQDFTLRFSGFPADALLYLLRDGDINAAIIPVCLLENMDNEGLINKEDYRPLLNYSTNTSCLTSTPLYPNWSFAALDTVPDTLVDKVTRTLLNDESDAMKWGAPASHSQVENLLREVNQHPRQRQLWQDAKIWAIQHRFIIGLSLGAIIFLVFNQIWISYLVRRRSHQLEQAHIHLREQKEALEQAQRLNILGEMASGFAHELNQPLSAIKSYAQGSAIRLEKENKNHPLLPALRQIDQQAQRGADIIRNLRLWVGKQSANSDTVPLSEQNIAQCIEHIWRLLRIDEKYPQVTLITKIDKHDTLYLPETLLEQILSNLITNSLQAGTKVLQISTHKAPDRLLIVIKDDAGGMSHSQLEQPFSPFQTTKTEGLGLGLVICQRLLNSQGADIHIENQKDKQNNVGLKITLIFPNNNN